MSSLRPGNTSSPPPLQTGKSAMGLGKNTQSIFFLQIGLFVVLLVFQIVLFERSATATATATATGATNDNSQMSFQRNRLELEEMKDPPKDSFGACLILMDDNHYLVEWLAYHYHTLPLRRLIVGIDPRSQTQPTEILNRWRKLMKITEWHEEDFMPPQIMHMHHEVGELDHLNLEYLYVERQKHFNTRCMAWMRHEGMSWVAMTDVDEYVAVNPYADGRRKIPPSTTKNQTIFQLIERNPNIHPMLHKGCISLHRLQVGTKESTNDQVQVNVPEGFNGMDFETLRYRYHAGIGNRKFNKVAKCLIDVSSVPGHWIQPDENDAHRPIKSKCGLTYLRIESKEAPFMAYHHAGTWEAWNFRNDFRSKRKRESYDLLAFDDERYQDDHVRHWLHDFVDEVGKEKAAELLKGAGYVPPKPEVIIMPGGAGNSTI